MINKTKQNTIMSFTNFFSNKMKITVRKCPPFIIWVIKKKQNKTKKNKRKKEKNKKKLTE